MNRKTKMIAIKLKVLTDKKTGQNKCVSFEELGVPFQSPYAMDLREMGFCFVDTDTKGKCGICLKRPYVEMTKPEFYEELANKA